MFIQQFYTKCLSEAAYYVESNGQAAIIDPIRDIDEYLAFAKERNASIKYIFETHFHADFVSGHLDLAKATGAPIVFGPGAKTNYAIINAKDGQVFSLGNIEIVALHTPGHTLESTCYLLRDERGHDKAIFTGDTLFVGDVGRPDLSSGNLLTEELAAIMFKTLQTKILPLADDVVVYPAHGPGSSCGKSMGPETNSTIGKERSTNYALQPQTEEDFIKAVTNGLGAAPKYFSINAQINQKGYDSIEEIKQKGTVALSVAAFKKKMIEADNVLVIDCRPAAEFTQGFIPGSIFIGLEGRFAEWAGNLISFDKPILVVAPEGKEEEAVVRLSRVGFDKMEGVLKNGFAAWANAGEPIDMVIDVEADELAMDLKHDPNAQVVDVRTAPEFAQGHVKNAENSPLAELTDLAQIAKYDELQNLYIHCAGGYRSVIAASLFKQQGYHNLRNVLGGWEKIKGEKDIKQEKETAALN